MPELATEIRITVNGNPETVAAATVKALLAEKEVAAEGRGVAVALNGAVVPRARWAATPLNSGDAVEIVQAKQGG